MTVDNTHILLVEDEYSHAELTIRAIKKTGRIYRIITVEDGEKALDYLFNRNGYEGQDLHPRPGLILLDIMLPGIDGIEVLKEIKEDPGLKRIPVVMLSTSERSEDINKSYDYYANSYITKPVNSQDFQRKINQVELYWMTVSKSPEFDNFV